MKIVFMGTPRAAVPSLNRLLIDGHDVLAVYTQPDRPSGRGNKVVFSPVKQFAVNNGLTVLQPQKIRNDEAAEVFRGHGADACVVVAYGKILPDTFLNAYGGGAINVHFSLLPKYRGAAPVNWAIANGETETGVTTMKMDAGLDTGPILCQQKMAIGSSENAIELTERLSILGADLLSETLSDLESITSKPQDNENATLAPILKREDGRIDWNIKAEVISNRIRAFQPFPTSFTFLRGERLTFWRALSIEGNDVRDRAGQVLEATGDTLVICCGGGSMLKIEELQLEGKRRMTPRDFINGVRLTTDEILT